MTTQAKPAREVSKLTMLAATVAILVLAHPCHAKKDRRPFDLTVTVEGVKYQGDPGYVFVPRVLNTPGQVYSVAPPATQRVTIKSPRGHVFHGQLVCNEFYKGFMGHACPELKPGDYSARDAGRINDPLGRSMWVQGKAMHDVEVQYTNKKGRVKTETFWFELVGGAE